MTGIVERLRDHKNYSPLHHEAADEIERLLEENNALRLAAGADEREIVRLREALSEIADYGTSADEIARRALEPTVRDVPDVAPDVAPALYPKSKT